MFKKIFENMHDYYISSLKIVLFFMVIFVFLPVSLCFAQSTDSDATKKQNDPNIEKVEKTMVEKDAEAAMKEEKEENDIMVEGEEAMMEAQNEKEMEIPEDEYHYNPVGKRDPFFSKMLVEKKKLEPNKRLFGVQKYELAELKLVGIIWGELGRKGVVETPDGKSYLIKVGTLIGRKDGVVKAITNNEAVIQEFTSDYLGNSIENISILKIQRKEQEQ